MMNAVQAHLGGKMTVSAQATVEFSSPDRLVSEPLVSVCMLAYRHERFIAQAIEGVVAQQCDFPIELIIGEDCSPDHTSEIVRAYQQQFPELIRVLTSEQNVGMHDNSIRCHNAARGIYLAYCEGDDYWQHPRKLQMQVDRMRADPSMTMCHTEFDRRIGFRIKRNRHNTAHHGDMATGDGYASLLREWTVATASSLYRKDVVDAFWTSPYYHADWPFGDYTLALFASLTGPIGYIPMSTATWRRAPGSASNSGPEKSLAMHLAATECRRFYMERHPVDSDSALSIEHAIQAKSMRLAFWAGREDIYCASLDWLIRHGYEHERLAHRAAKIAMRTRLPRSVLAGARNVLRAVAEFDPFT